MVDVHDKEARSRNMRAIRSKNTQPELKVRQWLHGAGFRFRLHRTDLPGSPDIVLPKHRVAIFVHGCFWHGHNCHLFKIPTTRTEFWLSKIRSNFARDYRDTEEAIKQGWRVITIWECALKGKKKWDAAVLREQVLQLVISKFKLAVIDSNPICVSNEIDNDSIIKLLSPHPEIEKI